MDADCVQGFLGTAHLALHLVRQRSMSSHCVPFQHQRFDQHLTPLRNLMELPPIPHKRVGLLCRALEFIHAFALQSHR